jgi:hypothetical protein
MRTSAAVSSGMKIHSAMFFHNEDTFSDVLREWGHTQRCSSGLKHIQAFA